jgi:hypothetical protein
MKNVSDKSCRENQNTFYVQKRLSKIVPFWEIMCKNTVEPCRPHMAICRMWIACRILKATYIQLEYVTLTATLVAGKRLYVTLHAQYLSYYYFTLTSEATRLVSGHISNAQSVASHRAGTDLILQQSTYLLSLGHQYFGFAFFVIPLAFHIHFPTIIWI